MLKSLLKAGLHRDREPPSSSDATERSGILDMIGRLVGEIVKVSYLRERRRGW